MSIETPFQRAPASISQEHHVVNHTLDILSFPAIVRGHIDPERMRKALKFVVNRHPALRTRFINENNTALRETFKLDDLPISFQNMTVSDQESLKKQIFLLEQEQRSSFPKRHVGPLFKCTFVRYDKDLSIFILVIDHIICDAVSIILLTKELFNAYENEDTCIENNDDPYTDFVVWQKNRVAKYQNDIAQYWLNIIHTTKMTNHPLSPESVKGSNRELLKLSIEDTKKLEGVADELHVSVFTLLLSAFKFLLSQLKLSDQPIRIVHSGRFRHKWKSIIGFFAGSVWIALDDYRDQPLADFIKTTQKSFQDAIRWSYVPCEYLEKLGEMPAAKIEIDYMPMDVFKHVGPQLEVTTLFDESLDYLQPDLDMQLLCYHHHQQLGFYLIYKNQISNKTILPYFESFLSRMIEKKA